jgi:hypothetical protein
MKYYVEDYDQGEEDSHQLKYHHRIGHNAFTAQEAAEDGWDKHDFREESWPLTIVLIDEKGESRWIVDMELSPSYFAREVKP